MNALVSGATGFLGGRLALRLSGLGWNVTVLGRSELAGAQLAEHPGIRFIRADLRDEDAIIRACRGQDVVFHCGALSAPWGAYREFYGSNVMGTRHVVSGCCKHSVERLVHVSTPSIYFDFTHRLGIAESDPLPGKSANAYAATKLLAEREVTRAAADGLRAIIIRPRALFGPGDTTILPRLIIANASRGIPLIAGGNSEIDFTYVDNAVDALLLCAEAPESALGRAYNITNGEPARLIDVLQMLFAKLGVGLRTRPVPYALAYGLAGVLELAARMTSGDKEPLLTRYTIGVLGRSQTLDISAARQHLGYIPRIGLQEGLEVFAEWWRRRAAHGGS